MKKTLVLLPIGIAVSLLLHFATPSVAAPSSDMLKLLSPCLPKAAIGASYQYSIASVLTTGQQKWILARTHDQVYTAPSYSVLVLQSGQCTNLNPFPVLDIAKNESIPLVIRQKFAPTIRKDQKVAYANFEKYIQKQYPGKSVAQLRSMGVFGMD